MKRLIQSLVLAGLLLLALPVTSFGTNSQKTFVLENQLASGVTDAQAEFVIGHCQGELNQLTGEQLTCREWVVKYYHGELDVTQLNKVTYRLNAGGGNILITIIDP